MGLPGGYKILYDGFEIRGDVRSGLSATVPFIMPWSVAGAFIANLLPAPSATAPNSIIWTPPYKLPITVTNLPVPLYAQSYVCQPKGWNGSAPSFLGLIFGDFFSQALVTAEFGIPGSIQGFGDDPNNFNQLDPTNPITACEQSLQMTSKVVTRKGAAYTYSGGSFNGKPVPGEVGILQPEAKLVCKFPRIPVLNWQLFQPYIGKINSTAVLGCVAGSLLLEGTTTVYTPGTDGSLAQNLGLMFAFNPDPTGSSPTGMSWNKFPIPDGSGYALIQGASGSAPPYSSADFRQIFNSINF